MGERLWIVAEVIAGHGIEFFGEEAERARELNEGSEAIGCFVDAGRSGERLDQPERARQECALGASESVMTGRIPVKERATRVESSRAIESIVSRTAGESGGSIPTSGRTSTDASKSSES